MRDEDFELSFSLFLLVGDFICALYKTSTPFSFSESLTSPLPHTFHAQYALVKFGVCFSINNFTCENLCLLVLLSCEACVFLSYFFVLFIHIMLIWEDVLRNLDTGSCYYPRATLFILQVIQQC